VFRENGTVADLVSVINLLAAETQECRNNE
jgi:hypothetical protein